MHEIRSARIRLFIRRKFPAQAAILNDADMFGAAVEMISEKYDKQCCEQPIGALTDFLDWLLANSDAIMALIKKLIELFS